MFFNYARLEELTHSEPSVHYDIDTRISNLNIDNNTKLKVYDILLNKICTLIDNIEENKHYDKEGSYYFNQIDKLNTYIDDSILTYSLVQQHGLSPSLLSLIDPKKTFQSVESLFETKSINDLTTIALEGIGEAVKNAWNKFVEFIKKIFRWFKEKFVAVLRWFGLMKKSTTTLANNVQAIKVDNIKPSSEAFNFYDEDNSIDEEDLDDTANKVRRIANIDPSNKKITKTFKKNVPDFSVPISGIDFVALTETYVEILPTLIKTFHNLIEMFKDKSKLEALIEQTQNKLKNFVAGQFSFLPKEFFRINTLDILTNGIACPKLESQRSYTAQAEDILGIFGRYLTKAVVALITGGNVEAGSNPTWSFIHVQKATPSIVKLMDIAASMPNFAEEFAKIQSVIDEANRALEKEDNALLTTFDILGTLLGGGTSTIRLVTIIMSVIPKLCNKLLIRYVQQIISIYRKVASGYLRVLTLKHENHPSAGYY